MLRMNARREYPVKCRDPRCSLACHANWRQKEASILRRLITRHLPDGVTVYRGNLTLRPGATRGDHSAVITKFLRTLKRREKQSGRTIRVHLTAHITAPDAMHYDLIMYGDGSGRWTRETVRDAWLGAGGLRYSPAGIDTEDERIKAAKYASKDTTDSRRKFTHLPARNAVNRTRYSAGSFVVPKDTLWQECIDAWFGTEDTEEVCVSNNDKPLYDHSGDPSTGKSLPGEVIA
jgi:hypothetical protein